MLGQAIKKFFDQYPREITVAYLFLLAYFPVLLWMWDRWFSPDSYYSHGILIPFVVGYLIWQKKEILRECRREPSVWGLRLVVLGLLIHLASSLVRVYFTSAFSMLIVLVGIILYFFGPRFLRQILFPIGFLFFMIPLPLLLVVSLSFNMKLVAAEISQRILNAMGLEAMRSGSVIKLSHAQIIVDDICSGLRSLISLAALGSLFAYWLKGPLYKRLLLFVLTIPIAVITNICRIVILSSIAEIWGPQYTIGFVHTLAGFMVFALAFMMLLAASRMIE